MRSALRRLCTLNKNNCKTTSLKGKKFLTPNDLSADEMKQLLTTALELKTSDKVQQLQYLVGKNITFLLDNPCLRLQTSLHKTSNFLQMPLNVLITPEWENREYPQDIGRLLSISSDIIFCKAHRQKKLEQLARGSTVPIINVSSCRFLLIEILSNLLTIHQHFGSLDGLTIAWVGHTCPLLNTYLTIAPALNMKVRFLCRCGGPVSPSDLHQVMSKGDAFTQRVKECTDLKEVIQGAHIIATTDHAEKDLKLNLADLNTYASREWIFFHTLPRTFHEVEEEVFDSDKNLLWASDMNHKWISAAIISSFLDLEGNI